MAFSEQKAKRIAEKYCTNDDERGLDTSFANVCSFLHENMAYFSWRSKKDCPSLENDEGLDAIAAKYFAGFRKPDFPSTPGTVPDDMVSIVMMVAFGTSRKNCERIRIEHQQMMAAENCVGALLERYLDSVLRPEGWHWCCGSLVKAVDFLKRNKKGKWQILQIKNRDNSENSSSSAIRDGKPIEKWFRTFSRTGATNWDNLPPLMQGYNLNEDGFGNFVCTYLAKEKAKRLTGR